MARVRRSARRRRSSLRGSRTVRHLRLPDVGGRAPDHLRAVMSALNGDAKAALRDAGVSQAAWARANFSPDGGWLGDACGCPDDRCIGYHHYANEACGCLPALLAEYLNGEGFFAETPKHANDDRPGDVCCPLLADCCAHPIPLEPRRSRLLIDVITTVAAAAVIALYLAGVL